MPTTEPEPASPTPTPPPPPPSSKPLPPPPPPARAGSPPRAPRKNAPGLPPTYLAHLRALLAQWLAQQQTTPGLPGADDVALWADDERARLEQALWDGAVARRPAGRGRGLLALDWAGVAAGAARRRAAHAKLAARAADAGVTVASSRASVADDGKLGVPPAAHLSSSPGSVRGMRTPSIASSSRSARGSADKDEADDDELKREEWCRVVRGLKGYEPLPPPKQDEWDLVNDDLPPASNHARDLPGAFPQASHDADSDAPPPSPSALPGPEPFSPTDLLKPVLCVRFDAAPSKPVSSAGTVRSQRQGSFGSTLGGSTGSVGSSAGRRWWANAASASRLSEMTATAEAEVAVEFVEGKYALPAARQGLDKGAARRRRTNDDEGVSAASSDGDDGSGDESDAESTWSGTQRAASRARHATTAAVVAGAENDVPPDADVRLLGGTIVVRGMARDAERKALERVIRVLAMYIELELLDAFRIPREPDPAPAPPPPPLPAKPQDRPRGSFDLHRRLSSRDRDRDRERDSQKRVRGLFQRFTRESRGVLDGLFGRASGSGRRGSDADQGRHGGALQRVDSAPAGPTAHADPPSASDFPSLRSEASLLPAAGAPTTAATVPLATDRHLQVLGRLERLLPSTTPGLALPMPPILLRVRDEDGARRDKVRAEADEVDGLPPSGTATPRVVSGATVGGAASVQETRGRALGYRLGGDVRTGLGAVYSAPDSFEGWVRLQKLDTLYAVGTIDEAAPADSDADGSPDDTPRGHATRAAKITLCQPPRPQSHVFWDAVRDESIAAYLAQVAEDAGDMAACAKAACDTVSGEHGRWWVHAGKRVGMTLERAAGVAAVPADEVEGVAPLVDVWVMCGECGTSSAPRAMGDVAASYSWSKFLELLFYTRLLIPPDLCEHAAAPAAFPPFTYHLRTRALTAALALGPVAVLDTRLPKLQVGPNVHKRKPGRAAAVAALEATMRRAARDEAIDGLRAEIECFFVGLEQRVAVLRLKSMKADSPSNESDHKVGDKERGRDEVPDSGEGLADLSASFRQRESALYDSLGSTPASQINDVRRQLVRAIDDCTSRLEKWQKSCQIEEAFDNVPLAIPDYARDPKIHCLPGSAVLVRDDEPSSLIAYTLASLAYFTELARAPSDEPTGSDADGVTVEVKRKDAPRDLLSLRTLAKKKSEASVAHASAGVGAAPRPPLALTPNAPASLVEVTHEQVEGRSQGGAGDRLGDLVRTISKATAQDPILTTNVRAARSPSLSAGSMSESDAGAPPQSALSSALGGLSALSSIRATPQSRPAQLVRRGTGSGTTDSAPPSAFRASRSVSGYATSPPPSTPATAATAATSGSASTAGTAAGREGWSSVTSTFASSFQSLVKTATDVGESLGSLKMRPGDGRSLTSLIGPLSLMSSMDTALTSTSALDELPHVQFTYTLADRARLGCTVYHATAFDSLRRRCAVDKSVIASLARSNVWDAQGGKSKASFFMTQDGRYIVKELVSKWNVSDTCVAWADWGGHDEVTHQACVARDCAGLLWPPRQHAQPRDESRQDCRLLLCPHARSAVEQQDRDGSARHGKPVLQAGRLADVRPQGYRKVPKVSAGGTLFDGEWLEGQAKSPILLHPHARRVLCEAVSIDTRFLCSQSIMDYSLLLGLDDARRELVVGLVDAIGSFNLFKTIESRGKQALNRSSAEVTIIPPDQYRERFENAIRQYFVACPDKWSKNAKTAPTSVERLPSVL